MNRTLATICPACRRNNKLVTGNDGKFPENGDANVCWRCQIVSVFQLDLPGRLRLPTDEEQAAFMADPNVRMVLQNIGLASTPSALMQGLGL